jgi:hypothetical protein
VSVAERWQNSDVGYIQERFFDCAGRRSPKARTERQSRPAPLPSFVRAGRMTAQLQSVRLVLLRYLGGSAFEFRTIVRGGM